jgi:hypothetical protein
MLEYALWSRNGFSSSKNSVGGFLGPIRLNVQDVNGQLIK